MLTKARQVNHEGLLKVFLDVGLDLLHVRVLVNVFRRPRQVIIPIRSSGQFHVQTGDL